MNDQATSILSFIGFGIATHDVNTNLREKGFKEPRRLVTTATLLLLVTATLALLVVGLR